jgi:hypothetical protein
MFAGFGSATSIRDTLSLNTLLAEVRAASSIKPDGQVRHQAGQSRRYTLSVQLGKLPPGVRDFGSLTGPGQQSIEEIIVLDTAGRPTGIGIDLGRARLATLYSRFNQPFHITAPPISQTAPA